MADVWPKHSLAESDPWARRVSGSAKNNERDIASLRTQSVAQNQATAASLDALRQQIAATQQLLNDLAAEVEQISQSGATWMGPVNTVGTVQAATVQGGTVHSTGPATVDGTFTSAGVALTDITTIPGTRTSVWVHDSAYVVGQTSSTIRKKTNLETVPFTAAQFRSVQPYLFQYKAQLAIRDDPENPYYDPDYEPTMEVGLMAEHLVEAGLGAFVLYDSDGLPANIDYAAFGAVAAIVIARDLDQRLSALESQ